ncbi:transcription factor bHLH18-like [Vicia villosa]|uniref:transcription factor bHLH18-like n=1 Tax=Vicia villosa TaxID=3911 RepID=UPI00273AF6E7|nr:transcription factor bHLH18-like [Vicia villosa]
MEESLENLISYMEMEDEVMDQSSNTFNEQEFLKDIILEEPECEPFSYLCSNEIQHNSSISAGNINIEVGVTSPTNSILSFDHDIEAIHKSYSSNSIISLERSCVNVGSPATYLLSFDNSSVEPIVEPMSNKRRSVKKDERKVKEATKRVRRSCETVQDHLMAERKRRRELTESIITLSAMIPGLKKMDKCYVLSEAVNYTKQLQKRIKELENNQNKDNIVINPAIFKWKSQASSNKRKYSESLLEVEARMMKKEVLVRIHCEKKKDIVLKIHELLENFNLTITSSSVLPFGASVLVINIFAQMDEEDSISMDELVKNLKKYLLEVCGNQ